MRGVVASTLRWTCILCVILLHCVCGKDYYHLLGLQKGCSDKQLKKAYRKLALQYHPDKASGSSDEKEEAARKFAEINHAYEVLSDEKKRAIYDRYGEEGLRQAGDDDAHDAGDIFSSFFGGGFGFGGFGGFGQQEEQEVKGDDVVMKLEVTLRDLYVGRHIELTRVKSLYKETTGKRQCNCKMKTVTKQVGPGMYQQFQKRVCEECPNVKLVRETVTLAVDVEPGMRHGQVITLYEEGEPHPDGDAGDLQVVLAQQPHKHMRRVGNDLHLTVEIHLLDALVGFQTEIEQLDGHKVLLANEGITVPGHVQLVTGEGMPKYADELHKGDLHVKYEVKFPSHLTEAQKKQARALLG